MLLEKKSKSDMEGNNQEDNTLGNLVSSLNTLSIDETSQKNIANLECGFPKVSLEDNKDIQNDECEKETFKTDKSSVIEEQVKKEDIEEREEKKLNTSAASDQSEKKEVQEKEVEVKKQREEENEDSNDDSVSVKEKKSYTLREKETDKAGEEKDKDVDQEKEEDDKDGENGTERKGENEAEKDISDSNNESSSDEAAVPVVIKRKDKKLLRRGLGAGTQSDQHYPYEVYQTGYSNFQCVQPAVAPIANVQQPVMSPQQGMSPGYPNMPVSPVPGFTEPIFNNVQNGSGYFDDAMSSLLGSSGTIGDRYWVPETPPSPNRGENDFSLSQGMPLLDFFPTHEEIEEVMRSAESHPIGNTPSEALITILDQLMSESCENPQLTQDSSSDNNVDWQSESEIMNLLQDNRMDYPAVLSPPAEDDVISEKSAEEMIQQHLDDALSNKARRRMAVITNEELTEKDSEGDNPCVVVACQDEKSPRYYENLVAMVERARAIDICCEKPVSKERRCLSCGQTDQNAFYSPFAMLNNEGDTLLSSVIRARQSRLVINYICENILPRQADINRIFGSHSANFYGHLIPHYPILARFLPSSF